MLEISPDAPAGTGEVGTRLIDPVTGDVLSENISPFGIAAARGAKLKAPVEFPQVTIEAEYAVANKGTAPAAIELKIWTDVPGGAPVSVFSAGADGLLVLPPGAVLTLDSLAPSEPIRIRVLDAASGEILDEK